MERLSLIQTQKKIESYLNAAAEGVKALCPIDGTTEEVEEFANKIKTMIANKIKTEKEKLTGENIQERNEKIATKVADEIKNMGSLLNDDETEV